MINFFLRKNRKAGRNYFPPAFHLKSIEENMDSLSLKINNSTVWLVLEPLCFHKGGKLTESQLFVCYFSFRLPITIPYGEMILDSEGKPVIFKSKEDAELYALKNLRAKLRGK